MTHIYRVTTTEQLHFSDPLHVGNFYPHLERKHPRMMKDRQDLILYLAGIHESAMKSGKPLGFCRIPMRLMSLRDWVYDYRVVFDHFFEVVQTGFNLGEKHEISTVIPKRIAGVQKESVLHTSKSGVQSESSVHTSRKLVYQPPELPSDGVVSKVYVQKQNRDAILSKLADTGRLDLYAPVEWLLDQVCEEVNFYFSPAGKLKLRDTSTWPIQAIETWPSWLRESLFGEGIDIESAYTQFLIEHIRDAYADRPHNVSLLFPDLVRSLEDKQRWRQEICEDILGLPFNDDNIGVVKKICMSLANGSKISPAIMTGTGNFSITRDIIIEKSENLKPSHLMAVGERLGKISKQYSQARKLVCTMEIGLNPSRKNQKLVFSNYFQWERDARYKIWEKIDRHGIMVHDGIDGVPQEYMSDIPSLVKSLNIRLT